MASKSSTEHVAANVRAEMARHRVTQTQIAAALGFSQAAVSRRLRGSVPFDVTELAVVAGLLRLPVTALVDGTPTAKAS